MAAGKAKGGVITTSEALALAEKMGEEVTRPTIIEWCIQYDIGYKVGGRWRVYKSELVKMIAGGNDAAQKPIK